MPPSGAARRVQTGVALERLAALNRELLHVPEGFSVHRKLERARERRASILDQPDERVDRLGHRRRARVRDGSRGRHRHSPDRGRRRARDVQPAPRRAARLRHRRRALPLGSLTQGAGIFEIHNSALTENATIGFEFGYNIQEPRRFVLWEAQYGDFINGAQVVLDEFVTSGRAKWGLTPSLVFLLPHGYEGQGPDHSSARVERFLQSAADTNMRIANCTTAAQYFHLLRRQALLLETDPLPLVVLTPKSLSAPCADRVDAAGARRGAISTADRR